MGSSDFLVEGARSYGVGDLFLCVSPSSRSSQSRIISFEKSYGMLALSQQLNSADLHFSHV
jgi:hypothetical protein